MDDVAIFWDYENVRVVAKGINVPLAESLIEYSESVGHPCVKKVYSNWVEIKQAISQALYSLGFDPIQVSMGKTNSVDVKIAVDCIDTALSNPSIKHFIIITGDKDFIPVVNWLKAHRKNVIIIGRPEVVSEHLLLSANDFISLEEISKMYKSHKFSKISEFKGKAISFEEAIKCLHEAITFARENGKSTRYPVIDTLMRSSANIDYKGASHVQTPDNSGTFSSFTKFIDTVEEAGKIKTETIEGFNEIFLIEEDPHVESEFSPKIQDKIDKSHWREICNIVIKSFIEEKTESENERSNKFSHMLIKLRTAKKQEILPYSNRILKNSLEKLIEIGFLIKQSDGTFKLVENYETNLESYLDKIYSVQ